jgi:uncharacterized protein (TIGR00255 family)
MTGFARAEGTAGSHAWTFEVKSVNGRNLDVRCRLPAGFDALEQKIRTAFAQRLKRGNVSVSLTVTRQAPATRVRVNRDILDQLLALSRDLEGVGMDRPRIDGLLSIRGVLETAEENESEEQRAELEAAMLASLVEALDRLTDARLGEGARLLGALEEHLAEIEKLTARADASAAMQPDAIRARLRAQVAALLEAAPTLPEERLAQEAALIAAKGDIREELDRLSAHVAAARELLGQGGPIGRQLDFLCQEFNREANTLCSKSSDMELTRIGLALKVAIEHLREQIQNIE